VQYFHDHASLTAAFSLKQNPLVEFSTTFGTKEISIGGEASYDTASGSFAKYTAGFGLTKPDYSTSVIL
jgi:voltage-dependent anion channel protein 2